MPYLRLLTSFAGRIGRQQWWLGLVTVLIMAVAGDLALSPEVFNTPPDQPVPKPGIAAVLFQLLMMVPATAITVKRFNDRNRPNWWGYALGAMGAFMAVAPFFGLLVDPLHLSTAELVIFLAIMLVSLAAFIDNGFLKGTAGPNRYGPDPLAA